MKHADYQKQKEYQQYVSEKSPKSKLSRDVALAYLVGGIICVIGQAVFDLGLYIGLNEKSAVGFSVIVMIFLGATLTGLGIYDNIGKYAGAGSIVPITGFANSIVAPAMEFKKEGMILGVGSKMFTIAGPVLVYGIGASVIAGIIYWIVGGLLG
ncbi:MAG TPA: stage V sporulation protein AC [Clostridia bacterium]|nr:stage V sporulation protein AC [Clostridia bacterium]